MSPFQAQAAPPRDTSREHTILDGAVAGIVQVDEYAAAGGATRAVCRRWGDRRCSARQVTSTLGGWPGWGGGDLVYSKNNTYIGWVDWGGGDLIYSGQNLHRVSVWGCHTWEGREGQGCYTT